VISHRERGVGELLHLISFFGGPVEEARRVHHLDPPVLTEDVTH
jgi:hypothetical protein